MYDYINIIHQTEKRKEKKKCPDKHEAHWKESDRSINSLDTHALPVAPAVRCPNVLDLGLTSDLYRAVYL